MYSESAYNENDNVVIFEHETNETRNLETSQNFKLLQVICTEKFPITLAKKIEITLKNQKKLYEIDLIAISNLRENSKYFLFR